MCQSRKCGWDRDRTCHIEYSSTSDLSSKKISFVFNELRRLVCDVPQHSAQVLSIRRDRVPQFAPSGFRAKTSKSRSVSRWGADLKTCSV